MIAASPVLSCGRAMAEEAARGGVDAEGAAAEIDPVEIEFEDLVLGEAPFERHRQDAFAHLADEAAVVGQEDVARELLGEGRAALRPAAALDATNSERTMPIGSTPRCERKRRSSTATIASRMIGGISSIGSHSPKLGPIGMDDRAVGGAHPHHLAEIVAADQLGIARQLVDRDRDRDAERDRSDQKRAEPDLEAGDDEAPKRRTAGGWGAGHRRLRDRVRSHGRKQKRVSA